jgi:hypothetical protein
MTTPAIGGSNPTVSSVSTNESVLNPSSKGLSNVPSTLISESQVGEEGGLCYWIGRMIDGFFNFFKSLFGCESANSSSISTIENAETNAASSLGNAEASLNNRIQRGVDILNDHFNSRCLDRLESNRSAIVIVLKYGDQFLTHYGRIPERGLDRNEFKEGAINQLRRLLSESPNRNCEDGRLVIETIVVRKNMGRYDFEAKNSWVQFPSGHSDSGMGSGNDRVSVEVFRLLQTAIPNNFPSAGAIRGQINNFIFNQL